jgi:hypothetical protein
MVCHIADEPAIITLTWTVARAGTTFTIAANITTANPALKRDIDIPLFYLENRHSSTRSLPPHAGLFEVAANRPFSRFAKGDQSSHARALTCHDACSVASRVYPNG